MILTIDIGNTNIMLGGFSSDELVFVSRMATDQHATEDEYAIRILSALSRRIVSVTCPYWSSVNAAV